MPRGRKGTDARAPQSGVVSPEQELYRIEKERRAGKPGPIDRALAEAQRAYEELLASQAASGKRGRPKKVVATRVNETDGEG